MATMGGDPGQKGKEKERLCPSCRMAISALATRCHYCGEEVARPKVEDRKLTIQDLGGHSQNNFQVSGSVLNALEAFRMEEGVSGTAGTPIPDRKSLLGKKDAQAKAEMAQAAQQQQKTMLLDELGLAPKAATPSVQRRDPAWITKVGVLGGFIAAIVILFFGGVKGFAMISDYLEQRRHANDPVVVNRAPEIIAQGGGVVAALEAAVEAHKAKPDEENEDILAQVRHMVADRIENSLNSPQWKLQDLKDASQLAHKAASIDPSNRLVNAYLDEIDKELEDYSFVINGIDYASKTATFKRMHLGRSQEVQVTQDEKLWGRFDVVSVQRDAVILLDNARETAPGTPRRIRVGVDQTVMLTNR